MTTISNHGEQQAPGDSPDGPTPPLAAPLLLGDRLHVTGWRLADKITTAWGRLRDTLLAWDNFQVALTLTLPLLLLHTNDFLYLRLPLTLLVVAAILHRPLLRSSLFWAAVTAVLVVGNLLNWYLIDNHQYLIVYWCLAICLALLTAEPEQQLRQTARLLIGLVFLFATFWKAISVDFLNGAFFHYSLLLNEHFINVAQWMGGVGNDAVYENNQALRGLVAPGSALDSVQLVDTPRIALIAQFITWWSILLEGLIAVAFLVPVGWALSRWRNLLLFVFLLTTYLVTPVIGFGWVLCALGAAQSTPRSRVHIFYVGAFFLLPIYLIPWEIVLDKLFGG